MFIFRRHYAIMGLLGGIYGASALTFAFRPLMELQDEYPRTPLDPSQPHMANDPRLWDGFGPSGDAPLDGAAVGRAFDARAAEIQPRHRRAN